MSRYAQVINGVVSNVIRIEGDLIHIEEDSHVGSGDTYDAETGEFQKDPLLVARDKAAAEAREAELAAEASAPNSV